MIFEEIVKNSYFITIEKEESTLDDAMYFYLRILEKKIILCDTHLGPKSMKPIIEFIRSNDWDHKEMILFNSHADWDHIWGNCAFDNPEIIGHKLCREIIESEGIQKLKEKSEYQMGSVEIVKPTIIFSDNYKLCDDKIEFIHTPSHTKDSAICYDHEKKVMYVGDVIEAPIPFVRTKNLEQYLEILKWIKESEVKKIISAHSGIITKALIDKNIEYIEKLRSKEVINFNDKIAKSYHEYNLDFLRED